MLPERGAPARHPPARARGFIPSEDECKTGSVLEEPAQNAQTRQKVKVAKRQPQGRRCRDWPRAVPRFWGVFEPIPSYATKPSRTMQPLRYNIVDVFTDKALEGNPLAVFTSGRSLSDERMQAIAREMNLSETVFFLPPQSGGHVRLRIFTPRRELPFAGHPVLGAAWILGGPMEMGVLRLETGSGVVEVRLEREGGELSRALMSQPLPRFADFALKEELWRALRLKQKAGSGTSVVEADNGPRHLLCELKDSQCVAQLEPDWSALERLFDGGVLVYALTGQGTAHARYFAPSAGLSEDPATGSAAGALGAHLAQRGWLASSELLRISQGAEMQRPSELLVQVQVTDGELIEVLVGGCARVVGRGELRL